MTQDPGGKLKTGTDVDLTSEPLAVPGSDQPDPRLTLAPRALAGSAACLNCGTPLNGPYCFYCGQPDRNFVRFFPALLREVLSESLEFDSRFMRTMVPLLLKPGRLTRDYLNGRRFRYTPPLRLYLFSSIFFFLLAAFLSSDAIELSMSNDRPNAGLEISAGSEEELAQLEEALSALPAGLRDQIQLDEENISVRGKENEEFFETEEINFNGSPWHPIDNPVAVGWWPSGLNDRINAEIAESPAKVKRINEDPQLIVREIFDILPATMFVLLPLVALIMKFWYLFSGRYYIEHLILALHNHSFVFIILVFSLLLQFLGGFAESRDLGWLQQGSFWLRVVLWIWIPVYVIGSLRTVYQQGWFMTLSKGCLIGLSYVMLLSFVLMTVLALGFIFV